MDKRNNKISQSGIHYYVYGKDQNKETIVFIHPAFANHHCFDQQIDFFNTEYNIITLDLIGHGGSHINKTTDKIDDTPRHLVEILDNEKVDKVHIVGVSIGSYLAQHFYNVYSNRVKSLTSLGGSNINNYDPSIEKKQRKQQLSFMIKALISIKLFSKSNSLVSAYTEKGQLAFYKMNVTFTRKSFLYLTTLGKIMNQNKLQIKIPILILFGEYDNCLAIELSKKWSEETENSKLVEISDAGHCANMDNANLFNQVVLDYIKSVEK